MKKSARRRIDVNLDELDRVLDGARQAPLSEADYEKVKDALHAMAAMLARPRNTEKTSAVVGQTVPCGAISRLSGRRCRPRCHRALVSTRLRCRAQAPPRRFLGNSSRGRCESGRTCAASFRFDPDVGCAPFVEPHQHNRNGDQWNAEDQRRYSAPPRLPQ